MTHEEMSAEQFRAWQEGQARRGRNKYGAIPVVIDGHRFDSTAEGRRYEQLKLLLDAGEITNLTLQPRFPLPVKGVVICEYRADFSYLDRDGTFIVEDVKGGAATKTQVYKIKKRLMAVCHGIDITEVEM